MPSVTASAVSPPPAATFTPLLLGGVLVFWGWHVGIWWLGLLLGLLVELPSYLGGYWEFGLRERQRVSDLCSLLVFLTGGYLYFTLPRIGDALILVVQWTPVLFFPLLAMQIYGGHQEVELSVLFLSLRKNQVHNHSTVDLRPFYVLICLLGAAMVSPPSATYYWAVGLISAWVFWQQRANGMAWWRWTLAMLVALSIGYGTSSGLVRLQMVVEDQVVAWLTSYLFANADPYRATTAIGEVGRLKLSEQIMLRVWPEKLLSSAPLLLRSGNFTRYVNGTWLAERSAFKPLVTSVNGSQLLEVGTPKHWVKVAMALRFGKGILPLPNGSRQLQGLEGMQLASNGAGVVKVSEGPGFVHYRAGYQAPETGMPSTAIDLRIPQMEFPALDQVLQQLKLQNLTPNQIVERIRNLFQRDFHYSLRLDASQAGRTAIADFLLRRRSGHCEYFASAAVLLLRRAGIPARYARGWSVQEYSELEQAYVARARHAHAWVLVWLDGAWHDFDPTPPVWGLMEAKARPWWGWLQDFWAWSGYRLATREQTQLNRYWLVGGLILLIVLLAWRVVRRGRSANKNTSASTALKQYKSESIFTPIEQILTVRSGARNSSETLRNWLQRLQHQGEVSAAELLPPLGLYYRQRFDPQGLDTADRQRLNQLLDAWLLRYR